MLSTPPGTFVEVGGHRLHVVCRGAGAPGVLLESGIAASSLSWAFVQPRIAAFTQACAYDRAGLAWSEAPASARTFDRICDDLAAVRGQVHGSARSILVGHSFGSLIVRGYAARYPDTIAGLVLVDPPTEWLTIAGDRARLIRGARRLSGIGAFLARVGIVRAALALLSGGKPGAPRALSRMFGARAARTLERLVGEVRKLPPELHPVVQEHWCQPKCFRAMAEYLLVLERDAGTIAAATPPREIPLVVISGGHQTDEETAVHRQLSETSLRGHHLVAAGSGHWVPFDEPDIVVLAVRMLMAGALSRD